ncbi:MAG: Maf family nucleotide pyrophosphatase [Bacteroidota bacterium]
MMFSQKRPVLLASKSPRRREMLSEAGFQFRVQAKEVAEDFPDDMPVAEVPEYLARLKARACRSFIQDNEILLAADSVVIQDQVIYGKPTDREDACRILRILSGNVHEVITGVCLMDGQKEKSFSGVSKVHFSHMTEEEIAYYVDAHQPYDKAGAYAIQEWVGLCKIYKIEGTYSNIRGLPMDLVYRELLQF